MQYTPPKNDNNLIIVRRYPGYFPFLWYCVLLIKEAAHMNDYMKALHQRFFQIGRAHV